MQRDRTVAKKKGFFAAAATGGSIALAFASLPLGVIGLVGAGYLTYDWFMFRAKRGMRF